MRGHYPSRLPVIQRFKHRFSQRATELRIGTSTKFVNQYQCPFSGLCQEFLHFGEMSAVGTQIALDRLIVSNIGQYFMEDPHFGEPACRARKRKRLKSST